MYKPRGSRTWWYQYYDSNGKRVRINSGETSERTARAKMGRIIGERKPVVKETVTYEDLERLTVADYEINRRKSDISHHYKHLRSAFAGEPASKINAAAVREYMHRRVMAGAANGTVNREVATLKHAFRLAKDAELVEKVPTFPKKLTEANAREGFVERVQFEALCKHLPDYVAPVARVAFITGWRKSELLSRDWRHVDLERGILRIEPGQSKNGGGREFPIVGELHDILLEQKQRKEDLEKKLGCIIRPVFFYYRTHRRFARAGARIQSFRGSWEKACKAAGLPGLLFHDLRRSVARDLVHAGVAQSEAMKLTGHLTDSVFRRYAISDTASRREAVEKLMAMRNGSASPGNSQKTAKNGGWDA